MRVEGDARSSPYEGCHGACSRVVLLQLQPCARLPICLHNSGSAGDLNKEREACDTARQVGAGYPMAPFRWFQRRFPAYGVDSLLMESIPFNR